MHEKVVLKWIFIEFYRNFLKRLEWYFIINFLFQQAKYLKCIFKVMIITNRNKHLHCINIPNGLEVYNISFKTYVHIIYLLERMYWIWNLKQIYKQKMYHFPGSVNRIRKKVC